MTKSLHPVRCSSMPWHRVCVVCVSLMVVGRPTGGLEAPLLHACKPTFSPCPPCLPPPPIPPGCSRDRLQDLWCQRRAPGFRRTHGFAVLISQRLPEEAKEPGRARHSCRKCLLRGLSSEDAGRAARVGAGSSLEGRACYPEKQKVRTHQQVKWLPFWLRSTPSSAQEWVPEVGLTVKYIVHYIWFKIKVCLLSKVHWPRMEG